ncbi:MAG: glutamate--tRNA ligase family protein, partial [Synechocystis sp.]|nr:glutamate--tRNA ligase family protein [Synechocystis sp.]
FKTMGFLPQAIANYMSLLGWTPPDSTQEIFSLSEAAQVFSLDRVNKAGAKFDWQKLDWINSQYLHAMPAAELVPLMMPHLQGAGLAVDAETDQAWLEGLATLIGPSLTRLTDAPQESALLFGDRLTLQEDGQQQLAIAGATAVLEAVLQFSQATPELSVDTAKAQINQLTKDLGLKKGVVMKSLRAGLMGTVQGPDLLQSWVLLHQKGWDCSRLQQALTGDARLS